MAIEMIEEFDLGTQIKVIGVGGGGGNAVEHMLNSGVTGVEFICANTDAQALNRSQADKLIQLGHTGLGAGAKPEAGKMAAEEAVDRIRESIDGAHMLFITAGMGGGTGTGAAPVIARVAKEMGILTVGVVTKPFEFEGARRMKQADSGLAELEANVDSLIVVLNEKLLDVLGEDVTQDEAFAQANDVLRNAVGGISDIIHIPGHVNVDFEDVKTVMSEPGKAMMGTATASGPDRATKAAESAVTCPLLEGIDLSGARGVLVLISAARATFKLSESRNAMNTIRRYAADEAHVIYGTAYDESLGDSLRVTVIATGLNANTRNQQKPVIAPVEPVANRQAPAWPQPVNVVQPVPVQQPAQPQVIPQNVPVVSHTINAQHMVQPIPVVRNGTDNLPILDAPVQPQVMPAMEHSVAPSVWRTNRTQAAAKVESLVSNGMDELEIPAFLRKQAD